MSLYKSKESSPKDAGGASWQPGPYKFKVAKAEVHNNGSVMMKLQTWTEDNKEGPKLTEWLNITSEKQGALDEVDRRLQVMLGKMELDNAADLVGKSGYIILRQGEKYLEAMPFGGFYTSERKSATGKESMSERIAEALRYKAPESSAPAAASGSAPDITEDMPF